MSVTADMNKNVPKMVKGKQFNMSMYKIHCKPTIQTLSRSMGQQICIVQTVGYLHLISKYSSDNCRVSLHTVYPRCGIDYQIGPMALSARSLTESCVLITSFPHPGLLTVEFELKLNLHSNTNLFQYSNKVN